MLHSQTANLPPSQKQRVHADFLTNEQSYLQMRSSLLERYRGQWVAIHDGCVVVAGEDLLKVTEVAAACSGHPYIAKVGEEDTVVFRVRRAESAPCRFRWTRTKDPL